MTRFLLTLLAGVLIGAGGMWYLLEGPPARHDAIGHWRGTLVDLRIEPDGTGRINTFDLAWQALDERVIELRYTEKGDGMVVDFELQDADSGRLGLPLLPVTLTRVADGAARG